MRRWSRKRSKSLGAGAPPGPADAVGAARSEDDVIRKILGLPKQHHLGTIPMYQWIHLVLADKLAYDGCRLNLVREKGKFFEIFNYL